MEVAAVNAHLAGGASGYVTRWYDQSGGGNDAVQVNPDYQPRLVLGSTPGSGPSLEFDGVDDYLHQEGLAYSARTVIAAWRIDPALQSASDLAQIWGHYGGWAHVAPDPRLPGTISFDGAGGGSTTARFGLDSALYGPFAANPTSAGWASGTWHQIAAEFNTTRSITEHTIGSLYPSFAIGVHQLGGQIAEILIFNQALSDSDRASAEEEQASELF